MEALADQMIAAVIDIAHDRLWDVAVVEGVTHPLPTTTTTTAAGPLVATALAATIIAAALRRANFMTGVTQVTADPHRVVAWEDRMSMVHHAPATLTILTMLGPDHLHVAMTIPTCPTVMAAPTRLEVAHHLHEALAPAAREADLHTTPRLNTHLAGTRVFARYRYATTRPCQRSTTRSQLKEILVAARADAIDYNTCLVQ